MSSMQPSKTSPEELNKLANVVYYLLNMLRSEKFDSNPPLCALLQNEHSKNGYGGVESSLSTLKTLAKLSTSQQARSAICSLGGLQGSAKLLTALRDKPLDKEVMELMRVACEILTNLTVGDQQNKRILISMDGLVPSLIDQLKSSDGRLQLASASVLRNLTWEADEQTREVLRNAKIVEALMKTAMSVHDASDYTLLCLLLNALWNVSAHSNQQGSNQKEICEHPGGLRFIVSLLSHGHDTIIENGGGILMNVSSHIARNEPFRKVLRMCNCFEILLQHLQFNNEVIVKNACNILWNLSARDATDQQILHSLGAAGLLGNLVNSENKEIATASSSALRNLLSLTTGGKFASGSFDEQVRYSTGYPSPRVQQLRPSGTHQFGKDRLASPRQISDGRGVQPISDVRKNNPKAQVRSRADSLWSSVNHLEESLDEPIDYSSKYDETSLNDEPVHWSNNSAFRCGPYGGENFQEHASRLQYIGYAKTPQPANVRNGDRILPFVSGVAAPRNVQMVVGPHYSEKYQDDISLSGPPECPRSYRTEDTPDDYSESMGSLNNSRNYMNLLNMSSHRPVPCGNFQMNDRWAVDRACSSYQSDRVVEDKTEILRGASAPYEPQSVVYADNPSSPNEVPIKYSTEDTPQECFSRASSLSSLSLRGSETDSSSQRRFPRDRSLEQAIALPSINENETLNLPPQAGKIINNTAAAGSKGIFKQPITEGAAAHAGTKTVTFDGALQTPLMYSRCSSMESLSSFDFHSVHSSVISDYSVRASAVVSPSELPDSPGDTVPPSPQQKPEASGCVPVVSSKDDKINNRNNNRHQAEKNIEENYSDNSFSDEEAMLNKVIQDGQPNRLSNNKTSRAFFVNRSSHVNSSHLARDSTLNNAFSDHGQDIPQVYAEEGTPLDFSRAVSMNNLSCEDYGKIGQKVEVCGPKSFGRVSEKLLPECEDTVRHYCIEGTPTTFSRNDSLSSLGLRDGTSSSRMSVTSNNLPPKLKSMQAALKSCGLLPASRNADKNITSTPASKVPPSLGDELLKYKTEGTPVKAPPISLGALETNAGSPGAIDPNDESESTFSDESNSSNPSLDDDSFKRIIEAHDHKSSMTSPSRKKANRKSGQGPVKSVPSTGVEAGDGAKESQERSLFLDDSCMMSSDCNTEANNTIIYRSPGTVLNVSKPATLKNNDGSSLTNCQMFNAEESSSGSLLEPRNNSVSRKLAEVESSVPEVGICDGNREESCVKVSPDPVDGSAASESRPEDADEVPSSATRELIRDLSNLGLQSRNRVRMPKKKFTSINEYFKSKNDINCLSEKVMGFYEKTDVRSVFDDESFSFLSSSSDGSRKKIGKQRGLFARKSVSSSTKDETRKNSKEELKKNFVDDKTKRNSKDDGDSKREPTASSREEPKNKNILSKLRRSFSRKNNVN